MSKLISYIIPCYHSEMTLGAVVQEIISTMQDMPQYATEIIMVNDSGGGQEDPTWKEILRLCAEKGESASAASDSHARPQLFGINFSRNFGQHAALMAGIRAAKGDILVCLDDDGQTPADEAGKLLQAIEDGADAVYASYETKHHSKFRNFGTWMNEKMLEVMLGKPKTLSVTSYFAMRRFIADEVIRYENSYPYLIGLVLRSTKNIVNVPVKHRSREIGTSGYTLGKLLSLWMNGFTAFSIKPLRITTAMGACFAFISFLYGIYTIIKKLVNPAVPVGFSAMMTAIIFFGGMIMLMLGLTGEYIGRTYISVNSAPQYVVRETTDDM